ncbi:MAG: peptidoglycan-binding domain-containing protein [Patescibacteria group bacterium]|nr:peptidoglycan-binding domain-containing protein [Patescibacteria group bacterium]
MSIFQLKKSASAKAASVFVGGAMALTLVFGGAVAPAQAQTVEELTAQISSLLAMISTLQAQLSGMGGDTTTGVSYNFTKNLSQGDSGVDVLNLQKVLNMSTDTQVAASGVGSAGNETEYFGSLTKVAVIKFQDKYASEILTPVGLTAGTGYVGASTRAKLNTMTAPTTPTTPGTTLPEGCTSTVGFSPTTGQACDGEAGTPTTPVSTGTGITAMAGVQPAATLAPQGAARVPFTKVVLTASADGDIVVNSLLVERDALSQDAAFAGIVLLDEDGTQLGVAKTLNSLHQATVGEAFTVKAGTSKVVTIAANMNASLFSYTGQVGSLDVIGVNTSAVVNATFPILGAQHTLNSSLTIGSATTARGIDDPNTSATKEVGVTDYTFAAIKITAGSAEKIRVHSLRWNQSGSVSTGDLENLKAYIDGVAYDLTVSADGKYYTVSLGSGIVIDKGLSKEIKVMGDIESGSGRTIIFDIYKDTDLYITGETYGYGITPTETGAATASDSSSQFTTGTPWYDNAVVTVSNGSLSASKATSVEAQNISENVANQPLGGFDIEAKGEAVSVASMVFYVTTSGTGAVEDITNVSLVDSNGSVVAGPVDGVGTSNTGTFTFTDSVTFPVGEATYTLQGQMGTDFLNDETVIINTNPSSDWTTVTGETTGNSITPSPSTDITANTMTLKAGTATISTSASPVAQNIVAGAQEFVFANFQFDATASGEDVRFTSLVLNNTMTGTNSEYQTGCQLWDRTTALNTGSNVKDIASGETAAQTFTLDSGGLTITKGTVKTVALKCNLSSSATSADGFLWSMTAAQTGTGLNSGTTITTATPTGSGQTMTAATAGTLTVAEQTGAYVIAAAGTTNVTLGSLKFTGTNEAITLSKLALELTNASSSPEDLVRVVLYDGSTQVGSAIFTGTSNYATSTIGTCAGCSDFTIPKDRNKILTLKGDLAQIGTSQVGTQGALLKVNYDGGNLSGTQGVGDQSGTTISSTSASDSTFDGVRVFRAYPEFAKIALSSSSLTSGTTDLYKFSVTAKDKDGLSNGIGVHKFTLNLATSSDNAVTGSTTVTDVKVYAYTDSSFSTTVDSSADGTAYTSGQVVDTVATLAGSTTGADNDLAFNSPLQIPAGTTYWFKVVGTVEIISGTGTDANNWVKSYISGDSAYEVVGGTNLLNTTTVIDTDTNDDFIWSPYATTTSAVNHLDWTNGYKVTGLAEGGMDSETINQ